MQPEERLDLLLSQRQPQDVFGGNDGKKGSVSSDGINGGEAGALDALLATADRFAVWGTAEPTPTFADQLEAELLARFAHPVEDVHLYGLIQGDVPADGRREDRHAPLMVDTRPGVSLQPLVDSDGRQKPNGGEEIQHLRARSSVRRTRRAPLVLLPCRLPQVHITSRLLWQAVAAAVLLMVGSGALAAAALGAGPGQPLYGMHRLEQGAWTDLATSPDERMHLHLQYAQEALDAFNAATAQHASDQADRDALTTFEQESQAAAEGIAGLPASDARTTLSAQLASLRSRAEQDLLAALPQLDWTLRAAVTAAIGHLGVSVPHVTQASISGASHNGSYLWMVTVTGSGFAASAVLLIDGRPIGTVVSSSATKLVVQVDGSQLSDGVHTIGVGNPDGTASIVSGIMTSRTTDDHGGSGGQGGSSGGGNGHGSSGGSGSGGTGGGGGSGSGSGDGGGSGHGGSGGSATATPTPSPTATPDDGGH